MEIITYNKVSGNIWPPNHSKNTDLDISIINWFGKLEVLAKALLFEVAHGELVSKGEEMKDSIPAIHQRSKNYRQHKIISPGCSAENRDVEISRDHI
jgi:hypothetical protein